MKSGASRRARGLVCCAAVLLLGCRSGSAAAGPATPGASSRANPMRIYWVDVEGGAATLVVAPTGETLLVDAGWADARDNGRIVRALEDVGRKRLDYLVTTHYHGDHLGGIPKILAEVPIAQFLDHGPSVDQGRAFDGYLAAVGSAKRVSVKPGDRFRLGDVEIVILTAAGGVVDPPLASAARNPACAGAVVKTDVPDEDPQSVGILARYGAFDFVDLGDVTWGVEHRLACPENRVGPIEVFQSSQHGSNESNAPQLVHALQPIAAVINNGPVKGALPETFETFKSSPGLRDIWQVHYADKNDAQHNTEEALIANATAGDEGRWIKATIQADGSFTITNGRTGQSRSYRSR